MQSASFMQQNKNDFAPTSLNVVRKKILKATFNTARIFSKYTSSIFRRMLYIAGRAQTRSVPNKSL